MKFWIGMFSGSIMTIIGIIILIYIMGDKHMRNIKRVD